MDELAWIDDGGDAARHLLCQIDNLPDEAIRLAPIATLANLRGVAETLLARIERETRKRWVEGNHG